jgi:hypothetical protein
MSIHYPAGDLARTVNHEANDEWPTRIEIVAHWDRKGKRKSASFEISADAFFGRNGNNAPMSGDALIQMIDNLRRQK